MARQSFRNRFFTPPVARAIMSHWSILLFGAVSAVVIVVGAPVAAGLAVGVAAYGGRVLAAVPRGGKREDRIDPFVLSEPWRGYVQGAQSAKLRFDRTVASTRSGPIRDRLTELSSRLDDGIRESWRIASRGDDIDAAIAELSTTQAQAELAQLRSQLRKDTTPSADTQSTIASLEAQIDSAERMQHVSTSTRDRLRLLDARFDELVARAVEVSVGSGDSGMLGNDVDDLVTELEGLRLAMDDTKRAEDGDTTPAPIAQAMQQATSPHASQPTAGSTE
jgi:hypothetical protein